MDYNFYQKENIHQCKPHISWKKKLWQKPVNYQNLMINYIKLAEILKMKLFILLQHQNNQYQQCIEKKELITKTFQWEWVVFLLALEKKQELMEKITGVFSEFTNLKKLNNSVLLIQKRVGKCMTKWSNKLKNFMNHLNYHIEL